MTQNRLLHHAIKVFKRFVRTPQDDYGNGYGRAMPVPATLGPRIPDDVQKAVRNFQRREARYMREAWKARERGDIPKWDFWMSKAAAMDFNKTGYYQYRCSCGGAMDHTH